MNQDYYFPLFGLFATAGKIFTCHLRQYAGIGRIGAAGYLCGKFCSVGRTAADLGLMGIR